MGGGGREGGGREFDETPRIFCDHVNFPKMNQEISIYGETKWNNLKEGVSYLSLFPLFSVIDCFEWFWMGSVHKNIQLMLEFHKTAFLVLHFSCCTLMTFLMM